MTTSVDEISRRFVAMSAERDRETRSETDGTGRRVPGGYVTEIVSKAPRTASGLETTTRREVFTEGVETSGRRTPTLQPVPSMELPPPPATTNRSSVSSANRVSSYEPLSTEPRPLPTYTGGSLARSIERLNPALRSPLSPPTVSAGSSFASPTPFRPLGGGGTAPSPATSTSSVRSVVFGTTTTRVVEPSRLTPIRVESNYAPVKYISRRELRKRKENTGPGPAFSQLRSSSVPRLDADRLSAGREFHAHRGSPTRRGPPSAPRPADADPDGEALFHNQAPIGSRSISNARVENYEAASSSSGRAAHDPYYETASDGGSSGSRAFYAHNRGSSSRSSTGRYSPSRRRPPPQDYDEEVQVEFRANGPPRYVERRSSRPSSAASNRSGSTGRAPSVNGGMTRVIRPVDNMTLADLGGMLAQLRGYHEFPQPPPYGEEAFCVVNRGTYLIKYATHGPHERFLSVRLVQDDRNRLTAPFLVWQKHKDSTTISERLHLSHLAAFSAGTHTENFRKYLLSRDTIEGPHTGGSKRTPLPTRFCFSLLFQSGNVARTVDLLALDDQTFRCWQLVMEYCAAVNGGGSPLMGGDVESLAAESIAPSSAF